MDLSSPHPSHALAIYAEPLVSGRRVLLLGDSTTGLSERIAEQGARIVHVYDPDGARAKQRASAASAKGAVSVFPLQAGSFDVRDGAFDVVIVPELAAVGDAGALLARVRRLIGPEGALLLGANNREAQPGDDSFDYYGLYDLVALQFANVRMVAEIPFSGVALAELGQSNPEVSVDTQLAPEGPAPRFVVLASQADVALDPYAIIQLPARPAAVSRQVEAEMAELRERSSKAKDAEARAGDNHVRAERLTQDLRKLEEELERQRARAFKLTRDLEEEKKARTKSDVELGMLRKNPEIERQRAKIVELEIALSSVEKTVVDDRVARSNAIEIETAFASAKKASADERAARSKVAELESALVLVEKAVLDERATRARLERGVEEASAEVKRLKHSLIEVRQVANEQFEAAHKRVETIQAELEAAYAARDDISRAFALEQQKRAAILAELEGYADRHAAEMGDIERTLHDRAKMIHALESELSRRERMIRELVSSVEELHHEAHSAGAGPAAEARVSEAVQRAHEEEKGVLTRDLDALRLGRKQAEERAEAVVRDAATLRTKLDALALEAARREGDVQTSGWKIAELERELGAAREALREAANRPAPALSTTPVAATTPAKALSESPELRQALDEINLLKSALVQEHGIRLRLESGEELTLARGELSRQAVLLQQLSR